MIEENRLNERMIPIKTNTFTEEQIVQILREAKVGAQTVGKVCRTHGIAENTFYTWRKQYGGEDVAAIKRLRELGQENVRLKRILAERDLEVDVLKEVLEKNGRAATTGDDPTRVRSWSVAPWSLRALPDQPLQRALPGAACTAAAKPASDGTAAHHRPGAAALWLSPCACDPWS